jgi:arsenite methyltransferase
VVISNGVINLCPDKGRAYAEAARVLRPGGRLAVADIVSAKQLAERTRRKVDLWAACVAGAIPQEQYVAAIEAAGLVVETIRENQAYRFISERALNACDKYGVTSVSLLARKPPLTDGAVESVPDADGCNASLSDNFVSGLASDPQHTTSAA